METRERGRRAQSQRPMVLSLARLCILLVLMASTLSLRLLRQAARPALASASRWATSAPSTGFTFARPMPPMPGMSATRLFSTEGGEEDTVVSTCTKKISDLLSPVHIKVTSSNDDPNGSHVRDTRDTPTVAQPLSTVYCLLPSCVLCANVLSAIMLCAACYVLCGVPLPTLASPLTPTLTLPSHPPTFTLPPSPSHLTHPPARSPLSPALPYPTPPTPHPLPPHP
jgi:hypothetical protein